MINLKKRWLQYNYLLSAIEADDVESASKLLDGGVDVDTVIEGKSAISICIERGKIMLADLLLKRGCSLSFRTPKGDYPLHLAVQRRDMNLVQMLLKNRIDITGVNLSGKTALHLACELNTPDIARVLIERSSEPLLNIADRNGRTPLMYACHSGMKDVVEYLLHKGSEVNVRDCNGETPLLLSVNQNGSCELIQCLLNAGADVNYQNKRHMNESALLRALSMICVTQTRYQEIALLLINSGSDLKVKSFLQQSPLHLATCANDFEIVKALLTAGCEVDDIDGLSLTPLLYTLRNGNKSKRILDLLVKAGADLELYDWDLLKKHFEYSHEIIDYLIVRSKEVKSLCALCRSVIRKNLKEDIKKTAKLLPLPLALINYIIHFET